MKRLIVLCVYHAIGRGGEVAFMNLDAMRFDEDQHGLWTGWQETKTGHQNEIPYFPDIADWEVDTIQALAVYAITAINRGKLTDNPLPEEPNWLFPEYVSLVDGGAATKVSKILSTLQKKGRVEGLGVEHTSHGLRAGPSDELAMNEQVDVIAMIMRGNWYVQYCFTMETFLHLVEYL